MKKYFFLALWLMNIEISLQSQTLDLQFVIVEDGTNQPIKDVHTFLVNTTYGTVSDAAGIVNLSFPRGISEDLFFSHISYDTKLFLARDYRNLNRGDTIWLAPNGLEVSEIVVSAKRGNKWKRNFKRFKKFFLGSDKAAEKCTILNPEVLRFEEQNGNLTAKAIDLIQIKNEYLGYHSKYLLTHFTVKANGSAVYSGKAVYEDLLTIENEEKLAKNRQRTYLNSPKHFFRSLIEANWEEEGYEIGNAILDKNGFVNNPALDFSNLIQEIPNSANFKIQFPEFLKVINKNTKEVNYNKVGVRSGSLESQRFSNSSAEFKPKVTFATSYLYKIAPFIEINPFGNILNTKMVKEYGFWANQRIAHQLPLDYGNDYSKIDNEVIDNSSSNLPKEEKVKEISDNQKLKLFTSLIYENNAALRIQIFEQIKRIWEPAFTPILIEFIRLSTDQTLIQHIIQLLEEKTGKNFGADHLSWTEWLWKSTEIYPNYYGDFKGTYYQHIDPKFKKYFQGRAHSSKIRLDEIVWGGVRQDGIPPLRNPKLINVEEASYLENNNIVFGIYLNGEAKAYPKRILAWHEFFTDTFGDTKIAGVYCTLCGTMIAYDMVHQGTFHDLGTSGFLYRSNKLMYDKKTQSLWSTIEGKPVLGPLANDSISLKSYSVVTTTWGQWKKQYPKTKVLSIDTGHDRDYAEGAAYAHYFGIDDLMFPVPKLDKRLANKAEVLIVRALNYQNDPLAISIQYLKKKKWHLDKIGDTNFVVLSNKTGASLAFPIGNIKMLNYKKGVLTDEKNRKWKIVNNALQSTDNQTIESLPSHNIFWFAWYNAYPETRLIK